MHLISACLFAAIPMLFSYTLRPQTERYYRSNIFHVNFNNFGEKATKMKIIQKIKIIHNKIFNYNTTHQKNVLFSVVYMYKIFSAYISGTCTNVSAFSERRGRARETRHSRQCLTEMKNCVFKFKIH